MPCCFPEEKSDLFFRHLIWFHHNVWDRNVVLPLGLDGKKKWMKAYVNDIIATLGIENRFIICQISYPEDSRESKVLQEHW